MSHWGVGIGLFQHCIGLIAVDVRLNYWMRDFCLSFGLYEEFIDELWVE